MANLTTGQASGTQTSTQNPQQVPSAAGAFTSGQQDGSLQPGTPTAALTSSNGLPLSNTPLHAINLAGITASPAQNTPVKHHTNPALFGVSVLLFLIALVLFYGASRPVSKNDNK